jgi:hypothetical protein
MIKSLYSSLCVAIRVRVSTLVIVSSAIVVSGCAGIGGEVRGDVSVFHQFPAAPAPDVTVAVRPWRSNLQDSLEFQAYAARVEQKLVQRGYAIAPSGARPTHILFMDYGIDDGRTETSSYSVPQFGVTGYSGATTRGTVSRVGSTSYVNATTTGTPIYGVTGYQSGTTSATVFRRFVNADVVQLDKSSDTHKKVYEGRLKSEGTCGNLPLVMPYLIDLLLSEFPGQTGQAGKRQVPWDGKC